MNATEFNAVLKKLRNDCQKHGSLTVDVHQINDSTVHISNTAWKRKYEISTVGLKKLIEVGYFKSQNQVDQIEFFNGNQIALILHIDEYMLFKKYKKKGMTFHMLKVLLIAGISTLLISLFMYLNNIDGVGNVSYSLTGNHSASPNYTINWYQTLVIGLLLILSYISLKLYDKYNTK